jgi:hypothetical protein
MDRLFLTFPGAIARDVRYAVRALRTSPGLAAAAILPAPGMEQSSKLPDLRTPSEHRPRTRSW